MIYRDEIVFTDRGGDVVSCVSRNGADDPMITITSKMSQVDRFGNGSVINSGRNQSVVFTEDEFRVFMSEMWERVLGEPFPG